MVMIGSFNCANYTDEEEMAEWYANDRFPSLEHVPGLIRARKLRMTLPEQPGEEVDIGQVGEIETIDPAIVHTLTGNGFIPVIAPIGSGQEGETYNINADTVAGAIAGAMGASKLILLTDVEGVLDKNKQLIKELSVAQIRALIADGTISAGMIPKIEACLEPLEKGVRKVHIIDGRERHSMLLEVYTARGVGTARFYPQPSPPAARRAGVGFAHERPCPELRVLIAQVPADRDRRSLRGPR